VRSTGCENLPILSVQVLGTGVFEESHNF
jgi:hypothetical protein